MKKRFILLSLLLLTSCGNSTYSDGTNVINFIQEHGELKSGIYYYDIDVNDSKYIKNYALYNTSASKIGVSYVNEGTTWSSAANKVITTSYIEEYGFFEPGKPWDATYLYYSYTFNSKTLVKKSWKATFTVNKSAFNTNSHEVYTEGDYVENFVVSVGDESTIGATKLYIISNLAQTFNICKGEHIISNMPYLF